MWTKRGLFLGLVSLMAVTWLVSDSIGASRSTLASGSAARATDDQLLRPDCSALLKLAPGLSKEDVLSTLRACHVETIQHLLRDRVVARDIHDVPKLAGAGAILATNHLQHSVHVEFRDGAVTFSLLSISLENDYGTWFAVGLKEERVLEGLAKVLSAYPDVVAYEAMPAAEAHYIYFGEDREPAVDVLLAHDLWLATWDNDVKPAAGAGSDLSPWEWYLVFHFAQGKLLSVEPELPDYYLQ